MFSKSKISRKRLFQPSSESKDQNLAKIGTGPGAFKLELDPITKKIN